MHIRAARPDEAGAISDLAVRSKAYWGYDEDFLAGSRVQLAVGPDEVGRRRVTVAERDDGVVLGFYALEGDPPVGELSLMFVAPCHIRGGVGRRLFAHAVSTARDVGLTAFTIDSDPFAEAFYLTMGAVRTGEARSPIRAGRKLPRLTFTVSSS
ncbi:GNAT family N-acetyltransferase [Actinophytocola sp.]|uniref:GNAT family N-acetyltransferase n=1 Tax=Actinophytocola sp. TaxID=1872138 RepID=UPI003899ABF1